MEQKEFSIESLEHYTTEQRARQLLQVWRDYYAEIFEVDLKTGSFVSLMGNEKSLWPGKGFVNIEVILMAEKMVHPDDKQAFKEFFDLDRVSELINSGIYVTKLNFRLADETGNYRWVKVKNIVPTKHISDDVCFFSCFRLVDEETGKDLKARQELSDAVIQARDKLESKKALISRIYKEIKTPLSGIIGMTELADENKDDIVRLTDRIKKISEEARKLDRSMAFIRENEDSDEDLDLFGHGELSDGAINKITYNVRKEVSEKAAVKEEKTEIPEDFVYTSGMKKNGINQHNYDFSGKRILVVEDNELNIEVMRELLEGAGAQVDVAEDGRRAVIQFVSKPAGTYDAILMDIDIPILDGYSSTRCIRISGKDDSHEIPVYAVTSNNFNEDVIKSIEYGFSAFFSKPVDFRTLFEKLAIDLIDNDKKKIKTANP
ncbi:MAG: response regulator [Lachnospiraceae bacterium]|nr:response regulator [Lachnospiraceae bacterium]